MGYIKRTQIGTPKYDPYKEGSKKFKDDYVQIFFNEINSHFPEQSKVGDTYGELRLSKLYPVVPRFDEYKKLEPLSKGRFNACAPILSVNREQHYNSEYADKYGSDLKKWPKEVLLKYAEENCKEYVKNLDNFLKTSPRVSDKNLEAELMNKSYDLITDEYKNPLWTHVLIKIKYKNESK